MPGQYKVKPSWTTQQYLVSSKWPNTQMCMFQSWGRIMNTLFVYWRSRRKLQSSRNLKNSKVCPQSCGRFPTRCILPSTAIDIDVARIASLSSLSHLQLSTHSALQRPTLGLLCLLVSWPISGGFLHRHTRLSSQPSTRKHFGKVLSPSHWTQMLACSSPGTLGRLHMCWWLHPPLKCRKEIINPGHK